MNNDFLMIPQASLGFTVIRRVVFNIWKHKY